MESLAAKALALEGTWRLDFDGIDLKWLYIAVENRRFHGRKGAFTVTGDFRLNQNQITAFLRVLRRGGAQSETIICVSGVCDGSLLTLTGASIDLAPVRIKVSMQRA